MIAYFFLENKCFVSRVPWFCHVSWVLLKEGSFFENRRVGSEVAEIDSSLALTISTESNTIVSVLFVSSDEETFLLLLVF